MIRSKSRFLSIAALTALLFIPIGAHAQQGDIVRGHITDDSSRALVRATVIVTRGPDRLVQQTTSDSTGAFSLAFDPGTGDYLVSVSAVGYASARRRVQREGTERVLAANFTLKRDLALLAAVNVKASKPVRATNDVSPYQPETGSSEKWKDGVEGQVPPSLAGDLNAIAGTMSNVTVTPAGPSILGSGSESNLNTLNGMGLAAGAIPRAANTTTRVTGATFDPTRGGFSGANIDVQLGPGNRFYQARRAFLTVGPSAFQFTDPTGRASGAQSTSLRGSLGADGELIRDALTYNVAVDLTHSVRQPATLSGADGNVLLRSGVSPDSIARLFTVIGPLGLAPVGHGVPLSQQHDVLSWIGRLDDTRDTLATRALTSYATYSRDGGIGFAPLSAASSASQQRQQTLGAQLTLGNYVGATRMVLNESRFGASLVHTTAVPYLAMPAANVLILSPLADGSTSATTASLGGGRVTVDDSRWTLEGSNQTTWNVDGKRNHFKGLLWARADGLEQRGIPNQLGTFTFNSLTDLSANRPSSFARTLTEPQRSGSVWNAAAAIAHQWAPSKTFSVLYGARFEADGFGSAPARNPALENALGVRTDVAPSRFHLSPRAGFSFTYNTDRDNGNGQNTNPVGSFYRSTVGVIRGGIGEFRDLLRPDVLASAAAATGLPGGTTAISCVGSVTPIPDWTSFDTNPSSVPTRCLDGSGLLSESAPPVSLISPSYDVPRSWRASLDWNSNYRSWLLRIAALGSYDLSQAGVVDANFAGAPQFSLAGDGNRPVFVSPAAIDPGSGSVSATQSRVSPAFGRVAMRTSDLRGYGGQITATISPDVFKFRNRFNFYSSLSYTLQDSRREYRGFDGAAFGDPRVKEWAPSNNDARHIVVLSGGFNTGKTGTITLFARAQSGLPFTPIVQGDVNGDGLSGDRAFVPNPALASDAALGAQLSSLLANGSSTARACILENLGRVASRNGCRGPWSATLNMQWRPPFPSRWLDRVKPNVYLENVLGGVDQMLHGNDLRGWGEQPLIDPVLLVPHGFDAATRQFAYTVNPRFADTRPGNSLSRNPFRITLDFSIDLTTDYNLQQLRRAVEPIRAANGWTRRSADSLTAFYLRRTSDVHKLLLENSDSLFLTTSQTVALRRSDSVYSTRVRAVYAQLGEYLASLNGADPGKVTLDSAKNVQKAYWKIFWEQPEIADSIITPSQRELMPMFKQMLSVAQADREHSQWQFGHPVTLKDEKGRGEKPSGVEKQVKQIK
ncbi:MAG: carboxypeptidase-like regulatory domain-containing protein [Gemmatimonadota bacterium]|nr:carboxypeptidase-like regulatory domain-containing protein [Gemmatimonadota bacterium]